MSLDPDDFKYHYGQRHGDAGIPLSIFSGNNSFVDETASQLLEAELWLKASKVFAHLETEKAVIDCLTRELIKNGRAYAIQQYGHIEKLPLEHLALSQNENCLRYLSTILFSQISAPLHAELFHLIDDTVESITSKSPTLAYDRVTRFQEMIHSGIVQYKGEGALLSVDGESIRRTLSTARLHLLISECEVSTLAQFKTLSASYSKRISSERLLNTPSEYGGEIKNWRVRHLKPFVWYFRAEDRARLRYLIQEAAPFHSSSLEKLKDQCASELVRQLRQA